MDVACVDPSPSFLRGVGCWGEGSVEAMKKSFLITAEESSRFVSLNRTFKGLCLVFKRLVYCHTRSCLQQSNELVNYIINS